MKMRFISMVIALGLVVVGVALAQQGDQESRNRLNERVRLRDQVVKTRVEIELLELDHDAAKADLLEIKKSIRELESEGAQEQMEEAAVARMMVTGDLRKIAEKGVNGEKELQDVLNATFKEQIVKTKAERDRKTKDYASEAAVLAGKRLELAEVEKRYDEIRFRRP